MYKILSVMERIKKVLKVPFCHQYKSKGKKIKLVEARYKREVT